MRMYTRTIMGLGRENFFLKQDFGIANNQVGTPCPCQEPASTPERPTHNATFEFCSAHNKMLAACAPENLGSPGTRRKLDS